MLEKPPHGSPCNGCGQCCMDEPCPLGAAVFRKATGSCPALEKADGDKWACGLVVHPERYAPVQTMIVGRSALGNAASVLVGAGIGCDAQLDDEPADMAFRAKMIGMRRGPYVRAAIAMWGFALAAR